MDANDLESTGNGLVPMAWANVDPDLYHHIASLGHNVLTWLSIGHPISYR